MPQNWLRYYLQRREFFCSAELVLGCDHTAPQAEAFVIDAAKSKDGIRIVSLTDLPSGYPALAPEAFVPFVSEHGLTPIAHLTGKDGNRSFLQARLLALARQRTENILALTGDYSRNGCDGRAKPVFDLDSVLILSLIGAMKKGIESQVGARRVKNPPCDFFPGAVVNPFKARESDLMMQFFKLELKIALGAQFIITQLGFNLRKLNELRQYMVQRGCGEVPVLANVYVPTATIAKRMQKGDIAGCMVNDELIRRLKTEKKKQRLERAALTVAAVKDLGFAGAHIGGFGLTHANLLTIWHRAFEIGSDWLHRVDELIFDGRDDFYLWPQSSDCLSDPSRPMQASKPSRRPNLTQRLGKIAHRGLIDADSMGSKFLKKRLVKENGGGNQGMWNWLLEAASLYRKAALGCVGCGDCIQDYLEYCGCTMRWCPKGLRNGPCGGSHADGTCEAESKRPCIWNEIYRRTLACDRQPAKYAQTLIPPRDWQLDSTNALVNRILELDNYRRRKSVVGSQKGEERC